MPRDAITIADLVGKLEVLRVACDKCGRSGRYRVAKLLAEHGPATRLTDWRFAIMADCPRVVAGRYSDWCGCHMPDLVGLFPVPPEAPRQRP